VKQLLQKAALAAAGVGVRRYAAAFALSATGAGVLVMHEGTVPTVYLDPVGIPTVCVGHTKTVTRADVGKDLSHLCAQLLASDTGDAQASVQRVVTVPITQAQYDALVSFTFNVGGGALRTSTLLRKLNAGDCWGAGAEFPRWNKARGRVLPGLVKRRADERRMFETGCSNENRQDTRVTLQTRAHGYPYAHVPG
jgi:lysozyme